LLVPDLVIKVIIMMCGGFQCSKNTLLGLNIIYVIVAFLLIGVASYGKSAAIITSLPLLGGIVASGVFLLFVAVLGLLATLKHHQVLLFAYMIILFVIFVIQFSVSCASLGVNEKQEMKAIETVWRNLEVKDIRTVYDAEKLLSCCGWTKTDQNDTKCAAPDALDQTMDWCKPVTVVNGTTQFSCPECNVLIQASVDSAFNGSGGLGLFFAFTEFVAIVITAKFRKEVRDMQPMP